MAENYVKMVINLKHYGIITTTKSETSFLDVSTGKTKTKTKIKVTIDFTVTKIKVTIDFTVYNNKGEKIKNIRTESLSLDKVTIEYKTLTRIIHKKV